VAGKASPAALLMALLLAMLRTLVDEELPLPMLVKRLNLQVSRHAPASRFITLFLSSYDPATGRLQFVNAGQTPPLLRRQNGAIERLLTSAHSRCMQARIKSRPRPSWVMRFSMPLNAIGGMPGSPTTSRYSCSAG
jgi:hypothetical protein